MESVYHVVTTRVNETSWAHVWRLRSPYLGTGYDNIPGDRWAVGAHAACFSALFTHYLGIDHFEMIEAWVQASS
jgi:hypothetical protein